MKYVVRMYKMKPSIYQDDFNIERVILWIHTPYKADFFYAFRGVNTLTSIIIFPNFSLTSPFSLTIDFSRVSIIIGPYGALHLI